MISEINKYKKSINESSFTALEISIIWEFYVTKSIAATAGQRRSVSDYGLKELPWKAMLEVAEVEQNNVKVLAANTIKKTLSIYGLDIVTDKVDSEHSTAIDVDTPRIICSTPYSIADEDKPLPKVGNAESVLTHIRNSLAHGNTYFFPNKNMLLEDIDRGKIITARIVLSQKTLLSWISLIDINHKFYNVGNGD